MGRLIETDFKTLFYIWHMVDNSAFTQKRLPRGNVVLVHEVSRSWEGDRSYNKENYLQTY